MKINKNYSTFEEIIEYLKSNKAPRSIIEGVLRINRQSVIDPLTKLPNRRYLHTRLEEEKSKSKRYKTSLSTIMIDIDHFKNVNDNLGHSAGDKVLKYLADFLTKNMRKEDIVGRYGGEEFLILLPDTKKKKAYLLAERIRKNIEYQKIKIKNDNNEQMHISVTVSMGVSDSLDELVEKADKALYEAKRAGKNKVKCSK